MGAALTQPQCFRKCEMVQLHGGRLSEFSGKISCKLRPSNAPPTNAPGDTAEKGHANSLHTNVHSSTAHNHQKVEGPLCVHGRMKG